MIQDEGEDARELVEAVRTVVDIQLAPCPLGRMVALAPRQPVV